jgi:hypothetical protein
MKKVAMVALLAVFAAGSMAAPVLAAKAKKAKPGMCGTFMYYDKKTKACKDKRG